MVEEQALSLETALAGAEREAETVLKAAAKVTSALKTLQKAAKEGDLRKLRAAPDTIRQQMAVLDQEVARVEESWNFDEESYLRDGRFTQELLRMAGARGLNLSEQDDRLYSYPVLLSIAAADRSVKIDRKTERRIRPSYLIHVLRERQRLPARFKAADFLESLLIAYEALVDRASKQRHFGSVAPLKEIYDLFTMTPGRSKEYALAEFTRDIYLVDISGVNTTRNGSVVEFSASTGAKSERGVLTIVTEAGAEKRYFGISFSKVT
ncbi:MAG TPA: hypothetical protein VNL71_08080 [Chloroflexota bacterium]|nr:hypothetical protein [Chloroflexota bacterium]